VAVAVAASLAVHEPPEVAPYVTTVVAPDASVRFERVMSWPLVETVPTVADVHPIEFDVTGAVQPVGTTIVTVPPEIPPVAAVKVKAMVLLVEPLATLVVVVVRVPVPSAA